MKPIFLIGIFIAALGCSVIADAALISNGNDLIYDTDRNITWYNPNVSNMTWDEAMSWTEGLIAGGATGWRLPSALNKDGSYPLYGYGVTGSEPGHLYYEELVNRAYGPLTSVGPFANLKPLNYWTNVTTSQFTGNAFAFNFKDGKQGHASKALSTGFTAIAVHEGYLVNKAPTIDVIIDVRPWSKSDRINYKKGQGILPVAILSTETFNATGEVDIHTLTFGITGDEQSLLSCRNISKDRKRGDTPDLICYFSVEETGFVCGANQGIFKGKTRYGTDIEGTDSVQIIHCR